jgi:hypothetical protein
VATQGAPYPVRFSVDYPDRPLNRWSTAFRIIVVIPILLVFIAVAGGESGGGGLLILGPLLMIVFRQKYPRWWFDWNLQLWRFSNRMGVYFALMDDTYPATDSEQAVHLDVAYPDVATELNRWMPLVKWLLAIPHYVVLFFLYIGLVVTVTISWFAILFTGRYPRGLFNYAEGVIRWSNRVDAYAFLMLTDVYPPFRLGE